MPHSSHYITSFGEEVLAIFIAPYENGGVYWVKNPYGSFNLVLANLVGLATHHGNKAVLEYLSNHDHTAFTQSQEFMQKENRNATQ